MAAATEGKYGEIRAELKEFHPGEPVFLLRATDPLAPVAVREYAKRCEESGCSTAHVEAAIAHAERIEEWQRAHFELVKSLPD